MDEQSQLKKQLESEYQKLQDQNAELIRLLEKRDTQIRKIHHQIKNNLQILASFIRLQSLKQEDVTTAKYLNDTALRLNFFSLMQTHFFEDNHEIVSQKSLENFIFDIKNLLLHTFKIGVDQIKFLIRLVKIEITTDQMMTVGFILSEILKIILEFKPGEIQNREIVLRTKISQHNLLHLEIMDSILKNMSYCEQFLSNSFEIELIRSLVQYQLHGIIHLPDERNRTFSFQFEVKSSKSPES